jgi:hypothetical protein
MPQPHENNIETPSMPPSACAHLSSTPATQRQPCSRRCAAREQEPPHQHMYHSSPQKREVCIDAAARVTVTLEQWPAASASCRSNTSISCIIIASTHSEDPAAPAPRTRWLDPDQCRMMPTALPRSPPPQYSLWQQTAATPSAPPRRPARPPNKVLQDYELSGYSSTCTSHIQMRPMSLPYSLEL